MSRDNLQDVIVEYAQEYSLYNYQRRVRWAQVKEALDQFEQEIRAAAGDEIEEER